MMKKQNNSGTWILKGLPFLFTLALFLSLIAATVSTEASAESADIDDALPEYHITLNDSGSRSDCDSVFVNENAVVITEAGSYTLTGTLSNGQLCIDTDKESKVRLVLAGVSITNGNSAAVYVRSADKVVIRLQDGSSNTLSTTGSFVQADENTVDAVVFSKDDLTVSGSGSLSVYSAAGHGIVSKDDLKVKNGNISITAARKTMCANDSLTVEEGNLVLDAGTEGMEASNVIINGGNISIHAGDDGINATWLTDTSRPAIEINGGSLTIVMGTGDTDGIDSNGDLSITGGTIDVTGNSTFDVDGSISFTGGTVIVNGQQVDSIPNQMMGGGFGGMGPGGMGHGGRQNAGEFGGENFTPPDNNDFSGGWSQDPGNGQQNHGPGFGNGQHGPCGGFGGEV